MQLVIGVLSDLHATGHPKNDIPSSYLKANPSGSDPNPFADLHQAIDEWSLRADLLVCPGDICDKGDQIGFAYAWSQLHALQRKLGAHELIATCGNHDLDSRYAAITADEDPDPKSALLQAVPPFPFGEHRDTDRYWARNFVVRQPSPGTTVIVLNTSAYHGGKEGELEHGRVSTRTINAILTAVQGTTLGDLNLLVCHHHLLPLKSWPGGADDVQFVKKGHDLLAALTEQTARPWLVLHGHRHIPQILSSASPPYVSVGAASFSKMGDEFSNQFHLITVEADAQSGSMPLAGQIDSWTWSRAKRWARYHDPARGLPPQCGFGYAGGVPYLVSAVERALGTAPFIAWDDAVQTAPELKFLTPEFTSALKSALRARNIHILTDDGIPRQIGRTK